jgi:hypothetical protein
LVVIDGFTNSGKSDLARRLATAPGACSQEILKRIEVTSTASIYVKRLVGQWWFDGKILSEAGCLEQAMALDEGAMQFTCQLSIEIFTYHFQFRPHERSTFVYTWDDTDQARDIR